jgi:hypothetical protein
MNLLYKTNPRRFPIQQLTPENKAMNHRKILALLVTLLLPWGLSAQTNPNKGGLSLDDIPTPGFLKSDESAEEEATGTEKIKGQVDELEENMIAARKAFATASESPSATVEALDALAARLKKNIAILGPDGDIGIDVVSLIKQASDEEKSLRAKSVDPKIDANVRAVYAQTADSVQDQVSQLFQTSEVLRQSTRRLEKQLKTVEDQKDLFVALIRVNNLKAANIAYINLTESINAIVASFDDLGTALPDSGPKPE